MNYDSFSHGQIQSKLWLCNELERFIHSNLKLAILGSWYNVLAFMLLTRNQDRYQYILGIDIDIEAKMVADKINEAWLLSDNHKVDHVVADVNTYDLSGYDVVINCSCEHIDGNDWFENLEYGTLVCIQSSDVDIKDDDVWKCVNPNKSLEELVLKYPLSKYLYSGEKEIRYSIDNGYKRFMLIGIK